MGKDSVLQCIVCAAKNWTDDADATRITRTRQGYRVVRCRACGLRRLEPMPSQDELRTFYEDDSLKHEYIRQNSSAYVAGADSAEQHVTERLKVLESQLGKPGRILDIGAAQGAFLFQAKQSGWDCAGIELSSEGVAEAGKLGLDVRQKTLREASFDDASFDGVHLSHVLEHLPDPLETLLEIRRILRPGGLLAIEVPNEFDDLFGSLRETFLRRRRPAYAVPSPHVYFYTPHTLKQLLERNGFHVFHEATPRRNAATASVFPMGALVRKTVFDIERRLLRGPNIEVYCSKPGGETSAAFG